MVFDQERIDQAVLLLDAWLETMRGPGGYCGPVVHWWQDSLAYTGPGLDWRYEGIIIGYLNLYERTTDLNWLTKARRAGDDLINGQLPSGNYRNSSFELNPNSGGTPHEAACAVALLLLAKTLRDLNDNSWECYAMSARKNLRNYHIEKLWNESLNGFGNSPRNLAITPNKSATIVEALFALASIDRDTELIEKYAIPTLDTVLAHQVLSIGQQLDGAIDQSSQDGHMSGRFFPYYIARCIPALLQGYKFTHNDRYLNAAKRALSFILRCRLPDGSFPQVLYKNGRVNTYPQWIAGVGDILRSMHLIREFDFNTYDEPTLNWLLDGQEASGSIRTARGFCSQNSQKKPPAKPEFRDFLSVCGWVDKAFRFLCSQVNGKLDHLDVNSQISEMQCLFRGHQAVYREDEHMIECVQAAEVVYRWHKGSSWAEGCKSWA